MNPSHSNKKGKRYRYYVSQAIIQGNKKEAGSFSKIPAGEIENLVRKEISDFLTDKDKIQEYISDFDIHKQKLILSKAAKLELTNNLIRTILLKNLYKILFFYDSLNKSNPVKPARSRLIQIIKAAISMIAAFMVEERRLELLTSCVQGRRSTN